MNKHAYSILEVIESKTIRLELINFDRVIED